MKLLTLLTTLLLGSTAPDQEVEVDERYPDYAPTTGVSGTIQSAGSDTMIHLMSHWCEGFIEVYPNVSQEIDGKGSSTAPPALERGTAIFGPVSRAMRAQEIDAFEEAHGYKPTAVRTSIDLLAIFVHKDNPIQSLSLSQVDAIFSANRVGGHPSDLTTWGDLGLEGEWADRPISLYGRNSASGTYGYFKEHALFGGDFKDTVMEQPGSSAVVQSVASDRYGMGYSGIGSRTADVRAVPLRFDAESEPVAPSGRVAFTGEYPLTRFLWLYINYRPGSVLDPLRREFLTYVFSAQGQADVIKDGYFPMPFNLARADMASVGLELVAREREDGDREL